MKRILFFLVIGAAVSCNDSGTADYNTDSVTSQGVDTGRHDTANYERMQDKTVNHADSAGGKNLSNSNDTANYERMPSKRVKDSTNY